MSGLVNFIKGLFGGIFGFLGGLFGGKKAIQGSTGTKKGKGYYLELDESAVKSEPTANSETSTKLEEVTSKPVSQQPMTVSVETATEATPAADNSQPAKKSTRKEKLAALATGAEQPNKSAATPSEPTPKAATAPTVAAAPTTETAFATKYLVSTNNGSRRRPGANMSSYLDMARKMNATG